MTNNEHKQCCEKCYRKPDAHDQLQGIVKKCGNLFCTCHSQPKKKDIIVCHGFVEHKLSEDCDFCKKVEEEYKKVFPQPSVAEWRKDITEVIYNETGELHHDIWDSIKKGLDLAYAQGQQDERERTEKLIIEEMLVCQKEGTPTSRLTSLLAAIKGEK